MATGDFGVPLYQKLKAKGTRASCIKAKCLDCCCYSLNEVRKCTAKDCPLWEYRIGRHPKNKRPQ